VPLAIAIGAGFAGAPISYTAAPTVAVQASTATEGASAEQLGAAARAIAAAIRRFGGSAVAAARAAMASYARFLTWWRGLPWYIRALGAGIDLSSLCWLRTAHRDTEYAVLNQST
jgi:hypothetical protein